MLVLGNIRKYEFLYFSLEIKQLCSISLIRTWSKNNWEHNTSVSTWLFSIIFSFVCLLNNIRPLCTTTVYYETPFSEILNSNIVKFMNIWFYYTLVSSFYDLCEKWMKKTQTEVVTSICLSTCFIPKNTHHIWWKLVLRDYI